MNKKMSPRYRKLCKDEENVCYTLYPADHTRPVRLSEDVRRYHAFITEVLNPYGSIDDLIRIHKGLRNSIQDGQWIKENESLKQPRPIYIVDLPMTSPLRVMLSELLSMWSTVLSISSFNPIAALLYYMPYLSNALVPVFPNSVKVLGPLSLLYPHIPTTLSNAIVAEKARNFVAKEIVTRYGIKGSEKANICIVYGAGHIGGIEVFLRHERLRKGIIKFNVYYNPFVHFGHQVTEYLYKVGEIRHINSPEPSEFAQEQIRKREIVGKFEYILYDIKLKI